MGLTIVAYGGGTNSTAMLAKMTRLGWKIDLILFADTGGEKPETYEYVKMFSEWLVSNGMPPIITVRKTMRNGLPETLEENCLKIRSLPSLAYGKKKCSQKFKIQPQDKFINNWSPARKEWKSGNKITKYIGYDAEEAHRARIAEDKKYIYQYPLIEWVMGRDECKEEIRTVGLPLPGKSSCFFCPSMKINEILWLKEVHPELLERALRIEENARLKTIKGLGRDFSWKNAIANQRFWSENEIQITCGCYDG